MDLVAYTHAHTYTTLQLNLSYQVIHISFNNEVNIHILIFRSKQKHKIVFI